MIAVYYLEPYFNLALEKVRKYYEDQGEEVDEYLSILHHTYEKIYCSSLFTFTDKSWVTPDMIKGGPGFDLKINLPEEIEKVKVYKNRGFTSRGCNRNCPFCVVPKIEGSFRTTGNIYDFWDQKSKKIIIYDSNILWDRKHFFKICSEAIVHDLQVDFQSGLDLRLFDDGICEMLLATKIKKLYVAWDRMKDEKIITEKVKLLHKWGFKNCMFYVLVGFETSIAQDLYRKKKINGWGYDCFFMPYDKQGNRLLREMCRWNNLFRFRHMSFNDFLKMRNVPVKLFEGE